MSSSINETEIKEFFDAWSVYDQVLDQNYMHHEELYCDVRNFLADFYKERPVSVLDLGCGSARHFARALEGRRICRYLGYDLSETALAEAAVNLKNIGSLAELRQGDLLEGLQANNELFDLIFSSFAVHHLVSADKAVFFNLAYQSLREDSMLLLIDVMREETEDLPVYLERYCEWIKTDWKAIPRQGLDAICEHIRNNDFPETISDLNTMAIQAGFGKGVEMGHYLWHRLLCFRKRPYLSI